MNNQFVVLKINPHHFIFHYLKKLMWLYYHFIFNLHFNYSFKLIIFYFIIETLIIIIKWVYCLFWDKYFNFFLNLIFKSN